MRFGPIPKSEIIMQAPPSMCFGWENAAAQPFVVA